MFALSEAEEYFELHLKYTFWSALEDSAKTAAIHMAKQDVQNFLAVDALDETDVFCYCAVFEQAVYLAEYFDVLNEPKLTVAEAVEGVGSRRYQATGKRPRISPRAVQFLERLRNPGAISRG